MPKCPPAPYTKKTSRQNHFKMSDSLNFVVVIVALLATFQLVRW